MKTLEPLQLAIAIQLDEDVTIHCGPAKDVPALAHFSPDQMVLYMRGRDDTLLMLARLVAGAIEDHRRQEMA